MIKLSVLSMLTAITLAVAGCDHDPMSEIGFRLPDGDTDRGRDVFLYMQCNQCHTIARTELPVIATAEPPYVELGGDVTRVKTYGQLVTAIINPSHELADGYAAEAVSENGESNMYIYNEYMTVQELVDLVTFLQPYYKVVPPQFDYRVYPH